MGEDVTELERCVVRRAELTIALYRSGYMVHLGPGPKDRCLVVSENALAQWVGAMYGNEYRIRELEREQG